MMGTLKMKNININEESTVICHKSPFKAPWFRVLFYSAVDETEKSVSMS